MALTLVEAAKLETGDVLRSAVIEIYARSSQLLAVLPFEDIEGNALKYNQESALPGIGFRGVNEGFTESTGVINPVVEALVIAGGDVDVDKFILDTQGQNQRAVQENMKIKALAQKISQTFIKGDSEVNLKEFDGLQKRLTGAQLVENHAGGNGQALSLALLDEAIDAVDSPTHLFMPKAMRRRLTTASRDTTVGGHIDFTQDSFGKRQTTYAEMPILEADENGSVFPALAFDEAGETGGSTATSIYILSLGDGMLTGLQNGGIDARDLGELEAKPTFRTRIEWYIAMTVMHPRSAARLRGITNAAVVV
jgi:hypothetical protein